MTWRSQKMGKNPFPFETSSEFTSLPWSFASLQWPWMGLALVTIVPYHYRHLGLLACRACSNQALVSGTKLLSSAVFKGHIVHAMCPKDTTCSFSNLHGWPLVGPGLVNFRYCSESMYTYLPNIYVIPNWPQWCLSPFDVANESPHWI